MRSTSRSFLLMLPLLFRYTTCPSITCLEYLWVFKAKGETLEVSKTDIKALDSVTFDCYQGEITLVLGDNGAGKTTLMHIVAGMIGTTFGAVFVNGINVAHRVMEHHEDLALCTQENIYFKYLTVKENISFFKKLHRNKPDEDQPDFTLDQLLKKLKLYDVADNYGSQLSSGTLRCLQERVSTYQ